MARDLNATPGSKVRAALTPEPQSVRDLAGLLGSPARVLSKALAQGTTRGWAVRLGHGQYARGHRWDTFVPDDRAADRLSLREGRHSLDRSQTLAVQLRALLTDEPQTVAELARGTGASSRVTSNALVRGLSEGWATRHGRGAYCRASREPATDIAGALVLGWLRTYGPRTLDELRAALPIHPERLFGLLVTLERHHVIRRDSDRYALVT